MFKDFDIPSLTEKPNNILEVSENADKKEIRLAYLRKIKQFPPDCYPEEFERIRDAYEVLKNPRSRIRSMLQSVDPENDLFCLFDDKSIEKRVFVGHKVWLDAM